MLSNIFLLQSSRVVHLWDLIAGTPGNISRKAVQNLIMEAYIGGAILAILMLGIAILIAYSVPYEPGRNTGDARKRRIWMIVLGVLFIILWFVIGLLATNNLTGRKAADLQQAMLISAIVSTVGYFGIAFLLSKVFRKTKLGTWFPSKKA